MRDAHQRLRSRVEGAIGQLDRLLETEGQRLMANIDIEVAGRRYNVACRDGEEEHLRAVAAEVDRRAQDAVTALGSLTETRQLLFAALLIADEIKEIRAGAGIPDPVPPPPDPAVARRWSGSPPGWRLWPTPLSGAARAPR